MFADSTQESLPSKALVENSSVINMQNFSKTRSPGTRRQFLSSQKNRQRRREAKNHELGVGLHRNVSNPNTSRSSSDVSSMYSDNEQKNSSFLQFPEIIPHYFTDLTSPISTPFFDYASPLITTNSQAMSTSLLDDVSHATSMPSLKLVSPLINFSMEPQTTSIPSLELPSPLVNFITEPQNISMPFLGDATPHTDFITDPPPLLNFSTVNPTSLTNFTTNSQAMPLVNSEKTINRFHNGANSIEKDGTF
ncbi:6319_t:CDS:1 [Racocetra fulgida]|uniref:6319_t:CDS:1 n=1 Tax=Racocetra fulgida TaxID=60492 RepID=A0A9N9ABF1_9GLOM|nr:6319_t:CDS:1 [Racocetra fulgida]